jgi:hypothetical protein
MTNQINFKGQTVVLDEDPKKGHSRTTHSPLGVPSIISNHVVVKVRQSD